MPLTPDEISELLSQPLLGHLAVVRDGKPHVTPIWVYGSDFMKDASW